MSSVTDNISPVLVSTKPILILCKCVGVCCLSNLFGNSQTRLLKYNLFSVGIIYQLFFVLYYQIYFTGSIWSLLYYRRKAHFVTLLSFFILVMFLECISSDKKLLKFLKSVEEIDVLVKKILPQKYNTLINLDVYKWSAGIFMFDVVLFFDRDCHWDISKCFKTDSLHSVIFHHLPYLSVISLFCTMCDQLVKRFQLVKTMIIENQDGLEEPFYLEECRSLYSLVVESTEIFLEWISLRITNHFILITLYSICQICFPCFYGNGCILTVVILRISQQMIMVCLMCYSASKLNEKVSPSNKCLKKV